MKKVLSFSVLVLLLLSFACSKQLTPKSTQYQEQIIILHTNDVHAGIDDNIGYAGLAAYKNELEDKYGEHNVILVDAGDAIQGASVAMLTRGSAIIELMNAVEYDFFVPGNHEFDYQIPRLFELSKDLKTQIISSNFLSLKENKSIYPGYKIYTVNDIDIAFLGVSTPESLTKASSQYFQDESANFIYSFAEDKSGKRLYDVVQKNINAAKADGADYIIGLVHLGIDAASKPWRSTDLIANTDGFDVVLDGHSHSVIEGEVFKDKAGKNVILAQTGTKLKYIGKITINQDTGKINAKLIGKDEKYNKKDPIVQAKIEKIKAEFAELLAKDIAVSDYNLLTSMNNVSLARIQETNLGDLVSDAYRIILDTDIGIVNGGAIRTNLAKGQINYQEIIDLHPFGNHIISMEISGKTLKDALEMGAKNTPTPNGGFLQVSGMTYEIDSSIPSSVKVDEHGNFISVDGPYRVKNIMIAGKKLDESKNYTVASHDYLLKKAGDGMTMFKNSKILKDMFMADSEVLIKFITENLNGKISSEYSNVDGSERIKILK